MIRSRARSHAGLLALLAPQAQAHLSGTGLGPFYDGAAQLLTSPQDLLLLIALTLLAGRSGPTAARALVLALPISWVAGVLLVLTLDPAASAGAPPPTSGPTPAVGLEPVVSVPQTLAVLTLGGLVAADRRLSVRALSALALVAGVWIGTGSAGAFGPSWLAPVGGWCALFVLTTLLSAQIASLRAPWTHIAVRIAGSWIAAIGLLTLGWSIRGT